MLSFLGKLVVGALVVWALLKLLQPFFLGIGVEINIPGLGL
jgi:hypothetical protein